MPRLNHLRRLMRDVLDNGAAVENTEQYDDANNNLQAAPPTTSAAHRDHVISSEPCTSRSSSPNESDISSDASVVITTTKAASLRCCHRRPKPRTTTMSAIRHGIAIIVPHANGAPPQMTFRLDEATTKTTYHSCEWRSRLDESVFADNLASQPHQPPPPPIPKHKPHAEVESIASTCAPSTSNTDWLVSANLHRSALTPQPSRHRHKVSTGSASGVFYDAHTTQHGGAHNLLARLAAGTQKCADMSKWRGAMVQYWADTGEVSQRLLVDHANCTPDMDSMATTICGEGYTVLCRRRTTQPSFVVRHSHSRELSCVRVEHVRERRLQAETLIYQLLHPAAADNPEQCVLGIMHIRWCVQRKAMLCPMMGPSIEELFGYCRRKLAVTTVALLAAQLISRLEHIHSCGIIHRDIKPDNLQMGVGPHRNVLYVVDFSLAKEWRLKQDTPCISTRKDLYRVRAVPGHLPHSQSGRDLDDTVAEHVAYAENKPQAGSARYASHNTHLEQSRRDDLESAGYVFAYLLRGVLPWQGLQAPDKRTKTNKIAHSKLTTNSQMLFAGFPAEFAEYMQYVRNLGFTERPDYARLRRLMMKVVDTESLNKVESYEFDWNRHRSPNGSLSTMATPFVPRRHLSTRKAAHVHSTPVL